jgi:hypothetical protein
VSKSADGLAAFVEGLPDGQRHKGFFWAIHTAVEDGLPDAEVAKVEKAGLDAGLDEAYVKRTVHEAKADRAEG